MTCTADHVECILEGILWGTGNSDNWNGGGNMHKKTAAVLLAALMAFQMPCAGVQAAKKTYMEKLNINWDLRPDGVAIPFETYVAGVGYRPCTVKFRTAEWKDMGNGRVRVKLKAVFKDKANLTDKEIHKVANSGYDVKRAYILTAVDYKTGEQIKTDGNLKYSNSGSYYIYDSHGCETTVANTVATWEFEADMPRDGVICIAAGGTTKEYIKNQPHNNEQWERLDDLECVDKNNSQVCHVMKLAFRND